MVGVARDVNVAPSVSVTGGLQQQALTTANLGVVSDLWMGHVTATSLRVSATVAGSPTAVRLVASEFSGFLQGWVGGPDTPGDYDIVKLDIDTLRPDTKYFIALEVDGEVDIDTVGVMTTPANPEGEPLSFQFGTASCSNFHDRVVYNHIRNNNPNMQLFMHSGDLHYEDINVNDEDLYQEAFSDTLGAPNVGAWFRAMPILYMWDDHDYGANDSGSDSPSRPAAMAAFRRRVPTPDLAAPGTTVDDAVYYTFRVGRLRFIVTDLRSQRSVQSLVPEGPNRTMMGAQQKAWFKSVLEDPANENDVFCWVNSVPWIGTPSGSSDFWAGYSTERAELATFFRDSGAWRRLFIVSGDMHALTHDDGTNSDYADGGGAPIWVFQCAPIANTNSVKGGPYSGDIIQEESLYGVFDVVDTGEQSITINFSGRFVSQSGNEESEVQTASMTMMLPMRVDVGLVTESNTAQEVTALQEGEIIEAIGQATETSTAQEVTALQESGVVVPIGQATESNTTAATTGAKRFLMELASETNEAFASMPLRVFLLGLAESTEEATETGALMDRSIVLGLAEERTTTTRLSSGLPPFWFTFYDQSTPGFKPSKRKHRPVVFMDRDDGTTYVIKRTGASTLELQEIEPTRHEEVFAPFHEPVMMVGKKPIRVFVEAGELQFEEYPHNVRSRPILFGDKERTRARDKRYILILHDDAV